MTRQEVHKKLSKPLVLVAELYKDLNTLYSKIDEDSEEAERIYNLRESVFQVYKSVMDELEKTK